MLRLSEERMRWSHGSGSAVTKNCCALAKDCGKHWWKLRLFKSDRMCADMQIHKYWSAARAAAEPVLRCKKGGKSRSWISRREIWGWFRLLVKNLYSFRLEPPWVELNTCGTGRCLCFRNELQLTEYFEGRKEGCFVLLETMPIGHVLLKHIYHLMLYMIWQNATGVHLSTAVVAEWYKGQEIWTGILETLF